MYYGDLTEIFQELDHRDTMAIKDPDDVNAHCTLFLLQMIKSPLFLLLFILIFGSI